MFSSYFSIKPQHMAYDRIPLSFSKLFFDLTRLQYISFYSFIISAHCPVSILLVASFMFILNSSLRQCAKWKKFVKCEKFVQLFTLYTIISIFMERKKRQVIDHLPFFLILSNKKTVTRLDLLFFYIRIFFSEIYLIKTNYY